ncbi:hypothetical protein [Streptosporangium canum]
MTSRVPKRVATTWKPPQLVDAALDGVAFLAAVGIEVGRADARL